MSLLGIGTTLINLYVPVSYLGVVYEETDATTQTRSMRTESTSAIMAYGASVRYNLFHKVGIAAHFESIPGITGKTTLLQGAGISGLYSFYGGAAVIQDNDVYSSVVAPILNAYVGIGVVQRHFDLRNQEDLKPTLVGALTRGFNKKGDLIGASVAVGADYTLFSPQFKITSEASYTLPLSVSTNLEMTLVNVRIGVGYQL